VLTGRQCGYYGPTATLSFRPCRVISKHADLGRQQDGFSRCNIVVTITVIVVLAGHLPVSEWITA